MRETVWPRPRGGTLIESAKTTLPIVLIIALAVGTGLIGVNFGFHWDEAFGQVKPLYRSIRNMTLLPGFYDYPSVNYWLNLLGLGPYGFRLLVAGVPTTSLLKDLGEFVLTNRFLLQLRAIRIVVSASAMVWVYVFVLNWRKSRLEATLSAAILGLSWEIAYHARWVAPDDVLMQFGALTLACTGMAVLHPNQVRWGRLGAIAAGLALGTKYPGGLLILPVLLATLVTRKSSDDMRKVWKPLLEAAFLFGLVFYLTTPGSVLQPWYFVHDVKTKLLQYGEAGHFGYTVTPGLAHMGLMVTYLGLDLFSHFPPTAVLLALAVLPGVYVSWRESRTLSAVLLVFPLVYFLYFATQRVMIVRNILVLGPFLAVFSGRGLTAVWSLTHGKIAHALLAIVLGIALSANAYWLVYAAGTIVDQGSNRFLEELAVYVSQHPDEHSVASPAVRAELQSIGFQPGANALQDRSGPGDYVLVYASEAMANEDWPANIHNLTVRTFGPEEVNFNYYPTWQGDDRILLMTFSNACLAGVNLVREACPATQWGTWRSATLTAH